ncbi:hypothetical protein COCOBI_02-8020 [Coccomyxa sp. Obi]|nr:hypothetical protein COCOBI_02-8020 [Coccomyxa sp. Obi]
MHFQSPQVQGQQEKQECTHPARGDKPLVIPAPKAHHLSDLRGRPSPGNNMDEDLRKLRQDVAVDLLPSSPAIIQASTEYESPQIKHDEDMGHLNVPAPHPPSEFHDWELLGGHSGTNSPRSSTMGLLGEKGPKVNWPSTEYVEMNPEIEGEAEVSEEHQTLEGAAKEHLPCSNTGMLDRDHDNVLPTTQDTGADNADEEMHVLNTSDASEEQGGATSVAEESAAEDATEDQQDTPVKESKGASPPDSPRLRSGTSSFSHISSPASYHFGNSDDDGSDADSSQWTSDEEGAVSKGKGSTATRSEADSEEALQDVVAVSQEGSLGSLSGSDAGQRLSRTNSARSAPSAGGSRLETGSGSFSFPEVLDMASGGSMSPLSPRSASSLQRRGSDMANKHDGAPTEDAKAAADAALRAAQDITAAVAAEFGDERAGNDDANDTIMNKDDDANFEEACPKKPRRGDVMGALRAGMDKLVAATHSTLQGIGSSEVVQRFWVCLQEWASALMACLPAAERARARLQMELARMRARARSIGWSQIALAASLAIMAVVAGCALVKNAALHRALRRKDNEMNQLILMVFNLQESLQGAARSSRVPIVRHACAVSSFAPLGHIQPANIVSFEALSATKAIYC